MFLCILEHIYILGYYLYCKVIALHFFMQCHEVEGVADGATQLEVEEERLWRDVYVERFWVPEFLHPHIFDDGKDKLCSLAPRRLVGAAVGVLGLVCRFRARADDSRVIVINLRVVGSDACWFGELRTISRCVICHRPNEDDQVVGSLRFVVWDLEEELRQDLPDSREVCV